MPSSKFAGRTGCSLLDRFVEQESTGRERTLKIKTSEKIKRIEKAFEKFAARECQIMEENNGYDKAIACAREIICTAEDVEEFSLLLVKHQDNRCFHWDAGTFLSAMMNLSEEREFIIHTSQLEGKLHCLGYRNSGKAILVKGDAGDWLGYKMECGSITGEGECRRRHRN